MKTKEFRILTSKQKGEDETYYIAHSTFLGKYSCHAEGKTRLEAVKNYLMESLEFIYLIEEKHGKELNEELEATEIDW